MWIVFFKEGGSLLVPFTPANSFALVAKTSVSVIA